MSDEPRMQWVRDAFGRGDLADAERQARAVSQVPAYDWDVLMALIGRLDADPEPRTEALYGVLDALVARGPRRIAGSYAGIRMPVRD